MKHTQLTILSLLTVVSITLNAEPYSAQQGLDKIKTNVETAKANKLDYEKNLNIINGNLTEVSKTKDHTQKQKDSVNTEIINNNESLKKVVLQEKELQALISAEEAKLAQEDKQLKDLQELTLKITENQKKRQQIIAEYKKQSDVVTEEKKSWKSREVELRAQEAKTIEALQGIATQEGSWIAKKKAYEAESKKWTAEAEKQEKISETYQALKEK